MLCHVMLHVIKIMLITKVMQTYNAEQSVSSW